MDRKACATLQTNRDNHNTNNYKYMIQLEQGPHAHINIILEQSRPTRTTLRTTFHRKRHWYSATVAAMLTCVSYYHFEKIPCGVIGTSSPPGVTGQESSRARSSPIWRMTNHGEISTPRDQS